MTPLWRMGADGDMLLGIRAVTLFAAVARKSDPNDDGEEGVSDPVSLQCMHPLLAQRGHG